MIRTMMFYLSKPNSIKSPSSEGLEALRLPGSRPLGSRLRNILSTKVARIGNTCFLHDFKSVQIWVGLYIVVTVSSIDLS